eukprot:TRINITY_DN2442_c0_g1_i1.p1 TRINITY_DN2442_c0_g1~~TRINITY_DN2442_c0_g1_i1.p1  ORF type:complete len:1501 (-),score=396.45 TRINITY_DN2442_c0_g1_i1:142-4644(-)
MFQPRGGAVDVIVVQQEDGSYKSAPWYVRFGKFQGILKRREKVVTLVVNDVVADFHMYLDGEGEAYFVREEEISDSPKLLEGGQQLLLEDGSAADGMPSDGSPTKELIEKAVANLASQRAAMSSGFSNEAPSGALRRDYSSENEQRGLPSPPSPEPHGLISNVLPPSPSTYGSLATAASPGTLSPLPPPVALPSAAFGADSRAVPTHLAAAIDTTALLLARSSAEAVAAEAAKGGGRSAPLDLASLSPAASAAAAAIEGAPSATAAAVHAAEAELMAAQAAAMEEEEKKSRDGDGGGEGGIQSAVSEPLPTVGGEPLIGEPLLAVAALEEKEDSAVDAAARRAGAAEEAAMAGADAVVEGAEAGAVGADVDSQSEAKAGADAEATVSGGNPDPAGALVEGTQTQLIMTLIRDEGAPEASQESEAPGVPLPLLQEEVSGEPQQVDGGVLLSQAEESPLGKEGESNEEKGVQDVEAERSDVLGGLNEEVPGGSELDGTVHRERSEFEVESETQELAAPDESQQNEEQQVQETAEQAAQQTVDKPPQGGMEQTHEAPVEEARTGQVQGGAVPGAVSEIDQLEQESASLRGSLGELQQDVAGARELEHAADVATEIPSVPLEPQEEEGTGGLQQGEAPLEPDQHDGSEEEVPLQVPSSEQAPTVQVNEERGDDVAEHSRQAGRVQKEEHKDELEEEAKGSFEESAGLSGESLGLGQVEQADAQEATEVPGSEPASLLQQDERGEMEDQQVPQQSAMTDEVASSQSKEDREQQLYQLVGSSMAAEPEPEKLTEPGKLSKKADTEGKVHASQDGEAARAGEALGHQQELQQEGERSEQGESQPQVAGALEEAVSEALSEAPADLEGEEHLQHLQVQDTGPIEAEQVAQQSGNEQLESIPGVQSESQEVAEEVLPKQEPLAEGLPAEQAQQSDLLTGAIPVASQDTSDNGSVTPSKGQIVPSVEADKEQQQGSPDPSPASKVNQLVQLASVAPSEAVTEVSPPFPGLELSLCRHLLSEHMGSDAAEKVFEDNKVAKHIFLRSPQAIVSNGNLVIRVENRYYPWVAAAPGLLAMLAYGHVLPPFLPSRTGGAIDVEKPQQKIPLPAQYNQELVLRTGWSYWLFGGGRKQANNRTAGQAGNTGTQVGPAQSGGGGGARATGGIGGGGGPGAQMAALRSEMMLAAAETALTDPLTRQMLYGMENFYHRPRKHRVRMAVPSAEQLASLPLQLGKNRICFYFFSQVLGKQQVECSLYVWKWNARVVISDVDGTITKSDVLGHVMPLVGRDWTQPGVVHLFSAIRENGYEMMFLSARAITQAHTTRNFLFGIKQDGSTMPEGPVVISPDGLFPSLYREVIRRRPHEFKIAVLTDILNLFPTTSNPFYAGFGNRETDAISYEAVGIPRGKIFTINPKGEVAVVSMVESKSYTSLHTLVHDIFPAVDKKTDNHLAREDYNNWNFWKMPLPDIDDDFELSRIDNKKEKSASSGNWGGSPPADSKKALVVRRGGSVG